MITDGIVFIDSHLIEKKLRIEGNEIICLDKLDNYYDSKLKRKNMESFLEDKNFQLIKGNIMNKERKEIGWKPEILIGEGPEGMRNGY